MDYHRSLILLRLTQRVRGRLDSHRQISFFRGFRFAPFSGRVSSRQPAVTRDVIFQVLGNIGLRKIIYVFHQSHNEIHKE
jgi:hypothetical protein